MKKVMFLVLIIICIALLSGCSSDDTKYPYVEYVNSVYRFDDYNQKIEIPNGYILDQGYSYDMVETEAGYDLIIHFVKDERDNI